MAIDNHDTHVIPITSPLETDWQYNGDFFEIGYRDNDGEGEWIVLASLSAGSLDTEADATWKTVHQVGACLAAAQRMLTTLQSVKAMMDAEPDAFSFEERVEVETAIRAANDSAYWTRDDPA